MSYFKTLSTATIGTLLEWAEYTFFAYMADQLSKHFFDIQDPSLALLKTYGIFATSYFMRPLGAMLWGTIGDTWGRKPALMCSMALMGVATVSIGCLPTFEQIGPTAAILLMLCRLIQGIAVAGEFHGAITFLHEHSLKHHPFFVGCLGPFAAAAGMAVGASCATLTQLPTAPIWAWRIPFLLSGFLCALAVYLRHNLSETPQFQRAKADKELERFPLWTALQHNRKALFTTAAVSLFIAVYVYIGNIYFKTVSIKVGGLSPLVAGHLVTAGQVLAALCILTTGTLADKLGGKKLCILGLSAAIIAGPFILWCARTGQIEYVLLGQFIYAVVNGLVSAPMMTLLLPLFNTNTRYSGTALGWSISAAIFGGTALIVADLLVTQGFIEGPGLYISLAAIIALWRMAVTTKEHQSTTNNFAHRRKSYKEYAGI